MMIDKAVYYIEMFLTLCGDIANSGISVFAMLIVAAATGMVIYAFYRAIICTLWPGETSLTHIKRKVLED